MNPKRLTRRAIEKPWGRRDLPPCFASMADGAHPIGEIWFEDNAGSHRPLLVKYLFTSERLSIQVHPGNEAGQAAGNAGGKDEAWFITEADEDAMIGLGLKKSTSRAALRLAAMDGSIMELVDWRPAAAGDFYYSPAGTIHALGASLVLVEVQQNVDATYRLYDYGRERELHLDEAVAVADPVPFEPSEASRDLGSGRAVLAEGGAFVVERWSHGISGVLKASATLPIWIIPLADGGEIGGEPLETGHVWIADRPARLEIGAGDILVAYEASDYIPDLIG
ncbi:class I mannose-6-phosphate isomerase [Allosphingosinicella sp.]|uniref:class I mannose-6-phosphate isomerase n=1 Tax=Allosphingosinicella sp. TaxID=2823234 RepID=UPI002FC1713B